MNEKTMKARRVLQALRAADQSGKGQVAGGMGAEATDRLGDLDAITLTYRSWSPALVPGLLQTDSYTASAIKTRTPSLGMDEIERRVTHRRRRTASFLGRRAGMAGSHAWFLIGEAAITRPITTWASHGEQLAQLLAVAQDYENFVIQVLRADLPQPGIVEPFEIFHLDPGPVVGHIESVIGGWYTIASSDIARLHNSFSDLNMWALTPTESRGFIQEAMETCSAHMRAPSSSSQPTPTRATASMSPVPTPAPSE